MASRLRALWHRFRTWAAVRTGLWRGRWQRHELQANVAHWTWWPWPFGARRWHYALYQPAGLASNAAAPLVVLLHGCKQEALGFAQASGWVAAADRERLRLLCPEQRDGANAWRCWNWFHPPAQAGKGELDVVMQALAEVRATHGCSWVAAVGLSAGGAMAALLAFHHASRLDAVVAVAAPPLLGLGNLQDPRQVMARGLAISAHLPVVLLRHCAPLLVLHGEADDVVAPACAEQLAAQARQVLARAHGPLAPRPATSAHGTGTDHLAGARLQLRELRLPGLGHAWTGGPGGHAYTPHDGPPLTALALDFIHTVTGDAA